MSAREARGWTLEELLAEWEYRYDERLGILCGAGKPEPWMERMAAREAQAVVDALVKRQNER